MDHQMTQSMLKHQQRPLIVGIPHLPAGGWKYLLAGSKQNAGWNYRKINFNTKATDYFLPLVFRVKKLRKPQKVQPHKQEEALLWLMPCLIHQGWTTGSWRHQASRWGPRSRPVRLQQMLRQISGFTGKVNVKHSTPLWGAGTKPTAAVLPVASHQCWQDFAWLHIKWCDKRASSPPHCTPSAGHRRANMFPSHRLWNLLLAASDEACFCEPRPRTLCLFEWFT